MNKRSLTERDICTMFIPPALKRAGWREMVQIREEVYCTKGGIIVRGKRFNRGKAKKADFVLYIKPNIPIAIIEEKDDYHGVGDWMQQGLEYATTIDVPFVFSRTATASCFTTAPASAGRGKPISASMPFLRPPLCGRATAAPRRASLPKPSRSRLKTTSTTGTRRSRITNLLNWWARQGSNL